jgi:hypothetical protein
MSSKKEGQEMHKIIRCVAGVVAFALLFSIALPKVVFADAAMDKKCVAAKAGTETDEAVKKECAAYFEQEKAAAAAGAGAGAAVAGGISGGTVALGVAIAAAIAAAIAIAASGGGGGGGFTPAHHH